MKKIAILSTGLLMIASSMVCATSMQSLNKTQVTKELQGKTITTIPLVTLNNEFMTNTFTGYFDTTGQIQGQFATKPDNDPQNDQGTWVVKSDGTLCATWQHWDKSKPICVTVYKLSNGLIFINQTNKKLETLILDENIKDGNHIS